MKRSSKKASRRGSSRRKPAVTRRVLDYDEEQDSNGNESNDDACSSSLIDLKDGSDSDQRDAKDQTTEKGSIDFDESNAVLPEDEDIDEKIVTCTACSSQVNPRMPGRVHVHPALGVLLCKKCMNNYNSGGFSKDDNGIDEYCRWCAEGGKLLCCDFCTNTFCERCIHRNLGGSTLAKIVKMNKWHCFMCDQSLLVELKAFCQLVLRRNKEGNSNQNHVDVLFVSPTPEMSAKEGVEICLSNSVKAVGIFGKALEAYRKTMANSQDAASVGRSLRSVLRATKANLESIERSVEKELEKCKMEQSKKNAGPGAKASGREDSDETVSVSPEVATKGSSAALLAGSDVDGKDNETDDGGEDETTADNGGVEISEEDDAGGSGDEFPAKVKKVADKNKLTKKALVNLQVSDSSGDDDVRLDSSRKDSKQHPKKRASDNPHKHVTSPPGPKSRKSVRYSKVVSPRRGQRKLRVESSNSMSSEDEPIAVKFAKKRKARQPMSNIAELRTDRKPDSKAVVLLKNLSPKLLAQFRADGVVDLKCKRRRDLSDSEAIDRDIVRLGNLKSLKKSKAKRKKVEDVSDDDDDNQVVDDDDEVVSANDDKIAKKDKKKPVEKAKKVKKVKPLFTSSDEDESDKLEDGIHAESEDEDEAKTMNDRTKKMSKDVLKESSDEHSDSDGSDSAEESKVRSKVRTKKANKKLSDTDDDDKQISDGDDSDYLPTLKKGKKRFNLVLLRAPVSDDDDDDDPDYVQNNAVSRAPLSDDDDPDYVQNSAHFWEGKKKKRTKRPLKKSSDDDASVKSDSSSFTATYKSRMLPAKKTAGSDDSDSSGDGAKRKQRRIMTMSSDSSDSDGGDAGDKKKVSPSRSSTRLASCPTTPRQSGGRQRLQQQPIRHGLRQRSAGPTVRQIGGIDSADE